MKAYLFLVSLVAAAGGFMFGFDTSVISGAIEFISAPGVFDLDEIQKGWAVSCIIIGCMGGCVVAGPLSDRIGRKKTLLLTALVFLVSSLGCALTSDYTVFIVNRIIAGLAVGSASMLAPMYIAEVAPARHRGKLVSLNIFSIFLGQFAAFFSNFLLRDFDGVDNWRWMIGIQAVPSGILFLLIFLIPESPRWLVKKTRSAEALNVLRRIGNPDSAAEELSNIQRSVSASSIGRFGELFRGRMLRMLIIGIALGVFQQVTGINVIMYYAPSIFVSAGFGMDSALMQTTLMGLVNLTFALASMLFVDRFGRKILMTIGATGMGVSLLTLALAFVTGNFQGYIVLACIMGFLACFGFSLGPVVWVIISEIFPNNLRSYAVAVTVFSIWASNFVVSFTFPLLLESMGGSTFFIYSFMCFLCLWFVIRYVTETKEKSLEQLERELVGIH